MREKVDIILGENLDAVCPFCGNSEYTIMSQGLCRTCKGKVEDTYCPICRRFQLYTIDKSGKVGCWGCKTVFESWQEYVNRRRRGLPKERIAL